MTFPIVVRVDRLRAVLISAKGGGRCYSGSLLEWNL